MMIVLKPMRRFNMKFYIPYPGNAIYRDLGIKKIWARIFIELAWMYYVNEVAIYAFYNGWEQPRRPEIIKQFFFQKYTPNM